MKNFFLVVGILALLSLSTSVQAQEETVLLTARGNQLSRDYLRPSISTLYFYDGSSQAKVVIDYLSQIKNPQFDENPVEPRVQKITIPEEGVLLDEVTKKLLQMRAGNQIMHTWFPSFINSSQGYSLETLEKRGLYAATDNDVLKNNASHRKTLLTELGEKLIDRSYILVYYLHYKEKSKSVDSEAFLYKLDFGPEVLNSFYQNYFNKSNGIDEFKFPLTFLKSVSGSSSNITSIFKTGIASVTSSIKGGDVNQGEVDANTIYEVINAKLGKKITDFQVKIAIVGKHPIRAKIGTKEGLKIDQRFDVMENRLNSEGKEVAKRKGVVRVKKVGDNSFIATGKTDEKQMSTFYKFIGAGFDEGMTLVKHSELGLGITALGANNSAGVALDYRLGFVPGLFAFVNLEFPLGKGTDDKFGIYNVSTSSDTKFTFFKIGLGGLKEFYFARNFFTAGGLGFGVVATSTNEKDAKLLYNNEEFSVMFAEPTARFGILILPEMQVFAKASYSIYFGNGKELFDSKYVSPVGFGLGLKYSF